LAVDVLRMMVFVSFVE